MRFLINGNNKYENKQSRGRKKEGHFFSSDLQINGIIVILTQNVKLGKKEKEKETKRTNFLFKKRKKKHCYLLIGFVNFSLPLQRKLSSSSQNKTTKKRENVHLFSLQLFFLKHPHFIYVSLIHQILHIFVLFFSFVL